jgi:GMP synthase (glutamine-hydrolysing)
VTRDKLEILREADAIYLDEIRKADLYDDLAGLCRAPAGADRRRHGRWPHLRVCLCALRAVTSVDGMTADFLSL